MKAITTKYLGPTNSRGSRIKASDGDGHSVTISYDYSLSGHDKVYAKAAYALCTKMNWNTSGLIGGGTKEGMVFVFAESEVFDNNLKSNLE